MFLEFRQGNSRGSKGTFLVALWYHTINRNQRRGDDAEVHFEDSVQMVLREFPEVMRHAREKRAPQKILGSSVAIIREFPINCLSWGWLGRKHIDLLQDCLARLAEDYQDLLHKLGILSRIVHDGYNDSFKVYIMGDCIPNFVARVAEHSDKRFERLKNFELRSTRVLRGHDVLPPKVAEDMIRLMKGLGIKYSNYFHEHIKDNFAINLSVAETYLSKIEDAISRFESFSPISPSTLRSERTKLGISQDMLGSICGVRRGKIAYLERGGYGNASKQMMNQLRLSVVHYSEPFRLEVQRIRSLCAFRFLRVSAVASVLNDAR